MGKYLNPGNLPFKESIGSKIYVDKTGLISYINQIIGTKQKFICSSRPRRFGKSMAIEMLVAYYSIGCTSEELFRNLEIVKDDSFEINLNKYDVLRIDVQWLRSNAERAEQTVPMLQEQVLQELRETYGQYISEKSTSISMALSDIFTATGKQFVILIDEWDCLFRLDKGNTALQEEYIEFLRGMFKGAQAEEFVAFAYMTGILPIKKYGTESALNNFREFTMLNPSVLSEYVGFTEKEVKELCQTYQMDYKEMEHWYDGYKFRRVEHVYSPKSIVECLLNEEFENYWTSTETYESLKIYIEMNFDGLKDAVITMLGGGRQSINPRTFQNDMQTFKNKDDILTLLIHLGYLAYDYETKEVFIPNQEIHSVFQDAVENSTWNEVIKAIENSKNLLEATLQKEGEVVAKAIELVHEETTSILNYNNENSLSCVISLAYYSARNDYILIREFPAGKGFADIVFLPRKCSTKPALVVELKWDKSVEGAIAQVQNKHYGNILRDYTGNVLCVGINYNKKDKKHTCVIEEYVAIV